MKRSTATATAPAPITVKCPIYGVEIGREQCQEQSSIIRKNMDVCCERGCSSPWRYCVHCLRQGYKGRDSVVVDPIGGGCAFHEEFGDDANRNNTPAKPVEAVYDRAPETKREAVIVGRVIVVATARVRPFAGQPRCYFDPTGLKGLEKSIFKRGQLQPGIVRKINGDPGHDYELVDGQRRWHACKALGFPFRAVIAEPKDSEDQFEMSIASNFQRADHTPMEIARAIDRMCGRGGRTELDLAELFGRSTSWVSSYRRLNALVPEIQKQLEPPIPEKERVPLVVAFQLAFMPPLEQLPKLQEIQTAGLSATAAVHSIIEARNKASIATGGIYRQRSGNQNFSSINSYVTRTVNQCRDLLNRIHPDDAALMFESKTAGAKESLCDSVKRAIEELTKLYERIHAVEVTE